MVDLFADMSGLGGIPHLYRWAVVNQDHLSHNAYVQLSDAIGVTVAARRLVFQGGAHFVRVPHVGFSLLGEGAPSTARLERDG